MGEMDEMWGEPAADLVGERSGIEEAGETLTGYIREGCRKAN